MNDILILRSDFYSEINPNNTQSCFTTDYENPLDYSGGCEVGIVEIIFPTNIKNCPIDENKRRIFLGMKPNNQIKGKYLTLRNRVILPNDNYKLISDLVKDLNDSISKSNDKSAVQENRKIINFFFNEKYDIDYNLPSVEVEGKHIVIKNGKIKVKFPGNEEEYTLFLIFPKFLNSMLGFTDNEQFEIKTKSKYQFDLYNNSHTLFIYSNIIQESFVSNIKTQLLRIFPLEKLEDDKHMKSIIFNPIIFRPLRVGVFDAISIEIRDSAGDLVIFESGSITITLMFRKVK